MSLAVHSREMNISTLQVLPHYKFDPHYLACYLLTSRIDLREEIEEREGIGTSESAVCTSCCML